MRHIWLLLSRWNFRNITCFLRDLLGLLVFLIKASSWLIITLLGHFRAPDLPQEALLETQQGPRRHIINHEKPVGKGSCELHLAARAALLFVGGGG